MDLSGYLLIPLREDGEFILYRAYSQQLEPSSVLLLTPFSTHPKAQVLEKIDHEYALRSDLDAAWALRPIEISSLNGMRVLALEDPGATPLDRVVAGPMAVQQFLRLAIRMSDAVGKLHKLVALLYLENNLAPCVFNARRLAVLSVLASAAAISLENGRLYRELQEREAKIGRLVDANIVGILIWHIEGQILEANDAFLHIVGYRREDLTGGRLRWTDLTPQEWQERDQQALADLRAVGSTQPYEKEYFRKDGSRLRVLVGGALIQHSGNQGIAFVHDLSEQKRAEEALRRSESYLAQAQRLAHIGSWAFDVLARKPLFLSEGWYRLYGFDPKDSTPAWEQWLQRIHPEDLPRFQTAVECAIAEKSEVDVEFRILSPRSAVRYVRSLGRPILDSSGAVTQLVGVTVDVTESKQAEKERERLRRTQAELAHMNRVSTLGELTASLAHEIKQPIGAAVTNAEACMRLLDRGRPDIVEAREAALEMVKDARRAADIIDRVRLLSKRSSKPELVDVNDVIREMVVMLENEASRHSVTINTDLTVGLPQ